MVIRQTAKMRTAEHLRKHGSINVVQAESLFMAGSTLATTVHRLRKEGWPIESYAIPGKSYVKYVLEEE